MRFIRERPGQTWPGLPKTHAMTKQQIITAFNAATKSEKDAMTRAARLWLSAKGINVTRQSLSLWRETRHDRSPLGKHYLRAYKYAIESLSRSQTEQ